MKDRIKSFFELVLMIAIPLVVIIFVCMHEDNTTKSIVNTTPIIDTVPAEPEFMNKEIHEGLREALDCYNIQCPDIVYAQAILETGHFKSDVCLNNNNLFGLYNSKDKEYYKFDHWSESVIAYKEWIQRKYKPPEDYYSFLQRVNYASDSLYTHKLKTIVENGKRRYTEGGTIPEGK